MVSLLSIVHEYVIPMPCVVLADDMGGYVGASAVKCHVSNGRILNIRYCNCPISFADGICGDHLRLSWILAVWQASSQPVVCKLQFDVY